MSDIGCKCGLTIPPGACQCVLCLDGELLGHEFQTETHHSCEGYTVGTCSGCDWKEVRTTRVEVNAAWRDHLNDLKYERAFQADIETHCSREDTYTEPVFFFDPVMLAHAQNGRGFS